MATPPLDGELDRLLEYIHDRRNFDFRGYKRASLSRRILKRMQAVGAEDYQRYTEMLEANPGEFRELFNTILINVTSLMRDPEAWQALAEEVIGPLVTQKGPLEPIRVWSAGCASGEEAYTLAVLLAEALGEERFRRSVKIYATDADAEALHVARHGRYPTSKLRAAFGEERTRRFFDEDGEESVFRADLRRALIFGRHDLVQDPPISRLDLISCRNTLMYFTSDVQMRILGNFHFALAPGGYLFLGKSEALVTRTGMFEPVDLRQHIFSRNGRAPHVGVLPAPAASRAASAWTAPPLSEELFDQVPVAELVVDDRSVIVAANREARRLLALGTGDVGRSYLELASLSRVVELRPAFERVLRDRHVVTVHDVAWATGDQPVTLDITVGPLEANGGVVVLLSDVSRYQHLRDELEASQRQLETAFEELQSAVEELETTNEELQATNEELETTNEELHSTNEELETMNEELQSTNEELETINNELRDRNEQVDDLNQFLESILGSIQSAVVVLDAEMQVRAWNRQAEELWGLRSDEVLGQHFLNLDIGFPVERLRSVIRDCVAGRSQRAQLSEPAVNRRGRPILCSVGISRLVGSAPLRGVILMMDSEDASRGPLPKEEEPAPAEAFPDGQLSEREGAGD